MAVVTPVPGNHCTGNLADGTPDIRLKCLKGLDDADQPIYTCATWRKFRVNCPKVNFQCSNLSKAWVAAITVCNQKLF